MDIVFVKGQGGLSRPLPGEDYISGMAFYNNTYPSGFSATTQIKQFFSPADAVAAGIAADYSDETQATAIYTVTGFGNTGDTVSLSVQEWKNKITFATYTRSATDTSITFGATGIAAAINTGTVTHGYKAVATGGSSGVVTITARKGTGVYLNTAAATLVQVSTGAITGAITLYTGASFTGGVASLRANYWYHINEFFRIQPKGQLWVGVFPVPGTYTFVEVKTMVDLSIGKIRQAFVYSPEQTFAAAQVTALQTNQNISEAAKKPYSIVYTSDISAVVDISTLSDLSTLTANKVSVCIAQDRNAMGNDLYNAYAKTIGTGGALLGAIALAKVSDDIGGLGKFNISNGTECETVGFGNGKAYSDPTITDSLLNAVNNLRYIYLTKTIGYDGSYFNDSHTSTTSTSDYAYIEGNRTIDKALRGLRTALLPALGSALKLNANGTMTDQTVAYFEGLCNSALDVMVRNGELSNYAAKIDTTQLVATTSKVIIAVSLLPVGVARNIQVNIGFVAKL
jgi:hypothetical protein